MDVDWRPYQRWVHVAGKAVNVIDMPGEGPPVLFIHGLSGCWQNWLENMPHFAAHGHRVVAIDLPGAGESEMPVEKITIAGYGRTVDALMDVLGLDAACIVGNSMGGFIGAEVAIAHPQRVERLVLVSAAGLTIENQRNEPLLALLRMTEGIATRLAAQTDLPVRRKRVRRIALAAVFAHPSRLSTELVYEVTRGSAKPHFVPALDALTSYPIRARLPEIECPTLIVWGDRDRLVPVGDAHEFEQLISGSRKVIFEDTGHLAMVERPVAFNALLERFLAE